MGSVIFSLFILWLIIRMINRKKNKVSSVASKHDRSEKNNTGSTVSDKDARALNPDSFHADTPGKHESMGHLSSEGTDPCHPSIRYKDVSDEEFFRGSMSTVSTEGADPCHEDMLHSSIIPEEDQPVSSPEPPLTPSNLARAFVLSEILTRPSERSYRYTGR